MIGMNRWAASRRAILRRLAALVLLPLARHAAAQEASATVEMTKLAFVPAKIEIKAGGSVIIVNHDLVPHTATADDGSFDTGTLGRDEQKEVVFPAAGEFTYVCRFHRHMTGVVRVT